jgi:hypothetical protein
MFLILFLATSVRLSVQLLSSLTFQELKYYEKLPNEIKAEDIVKASVDPSFFWAPSGA